MKYYRMTITELLLQTEWWQCQDGMPIRLEDMEPSHRFNTLAWLLRRSRMLFRHYLWHVACNTPERALATAEANDVLMETTERWLSRQPLVIELVRLIKIDDSIEGAVVEGHTELIEQLALPSGDRAVQLDSYIKGENRP